MLNVIKLDFRNLPPEKFYRIGPRKSNLKQNDLFEVGALAAHVGPGQDEEAGRRRPKISRLNVQTFLD